MVNAFIERIFELSETRRKTDMASLLNQQFAAGPNLDKKCAWLYNPAPSHEMLTNICCKIYKVALSCFQKVLFASMKAL